jgi:hypothetical protein
MGILPAEYDASFCPSDDRLVNHYLRAKIAGKMSHLPNACYFYDADVCSARPEDLVRDHGVPARVPGKDAGGGEQWFFFCPVRFTGGSMTRRSRTVDGTGDTECWHAEGRPRPVEGGGGFVQKFSYHVKVAPGVVEKPGWIMAEYSIGDGDTVLCKVYRSPRGPGRPCKAASAAAVAMRCKRTAAVSRSNKRQWAPETEEGVMPPSAGNIESDDAVPVEVEDYAAAPEFREALSYVGEWQPEEHAAPELREVLQVVVGEYMRLLLTEEVDDSMVLGLYDVVEASL